MEAQLDAALDAPRRPIFSMNRFQILRGLKFRGLKGTHNGVLVYWCHICGGYGFVDMNGVTLSCPHCKGQLYEPQDDRY